HPVSPLIPLPHGALLDPLLERVAMHDALHENAGGVDLVWLDLAGIDELLDLHDGDLGGGRHHRVEVARGLAEDEVALAVRLPGMDDRQVGEEPALHDISRAVEVARLLALGDEGADAGLGEKRRNAGAAGADSLGERALRVEFELQLALQIK